ncbi:VOC family protein [Oleiagrimonas sp. MCCC 1A03011]|uniref:VOC family protein n=1 Tax=Oleiagrimonas sp. MCCC 1A03011 TaxID=1926883 RepID=UPI000DC5590E|nr:VOC family protein [Oleiagrimonas sp. MCCC 1A03011]RAP56423.1 glyoxalase/bleomycin resistance/extradiol dioxygenase family protein [Oleiagrimonas sp. MCCC 1A03011]
MIDHVDFAVTDLPRSRAFYMKVLAPLGMAPVASVDRSDGDGHRGVGFGTLEKPVFWIGCGDPVQGRLHVAFRAESRDAVNAFHRAALTAGGIDHGAPGLRPHYHAHYYAAYVRDPDGHVIEAVCHHWH